MLCRLPLVHVQTHMHVLLVLIPLSPLSSADFLTYKNGTYHHTTGASLGGHAIKFVGWGTDAAGVDYWTVRVNCLAACKLARIRRTHA